MLPLKPANPYHCLVRRGQVFRGADGKTALKLYYVDIIGRKDPTRTEWDKCGLVEVDFLAMLSKASGVEGVGFVTAFPHITKVFRFGPESEIVLNVRAYNTRDLSDLSLARSDGYVECACLAEAIIAADEFRLWETAASVEAYLAQWSLYAEGEIRDKDKLLRYWGA